MRAFPPRWKVSAPEFIAETVSSRIWKVVREDGSPAIVKDLKPFDDVADDLRGEHFLAWRCGEGAVPVTGCSRSISSSMATMPRSRPR